MHKSNLQLKQVLLQNQDINLILKGLRKNKKNKTTKFLKNFWKQRKLDYKIKTLSNKMQLNSLNVKKIKFRQWSLQKVNLISKYWNTKCFKHRRMLKFSWLSKLALLQNLAQNCPQFQIKKNQKFKRKMIKSLRISNEINYCTHFVFSSLKIYNLSNQIWK